MPTTPNTSLLTRRTALQFVGATVMTATLAPLAGTLPVDPLPATPAPPADVATLAATIERVRQIRDTARNQYVAADARGDAVPYDVVRQAIKALVALQHELVDRYGEDGRQVWVMAVETVCPPDAA